MATYGDVLATLRDYRNELAIATQTEFEGRLDGGEGTLVSFSARGAASAFATPLSNVHATGVGVRVRGGKIQHDEFVLKVYVFDKQDLGEATPALTQSFRDVEVDVEPLPVQMAVAQKTKAAHPRATTITNRRKHRPIPGGVSIAPINEPFVGTLGCFVRRVTSGTEQIFALSNNHVMADTNRLVIGTPIVQPGPEVGPTGNADIFAALSAFVPIHFPASRLAPAVNRFDAAIALVGSRDLVSLGKMLGIPKYVPRVSSAVPGMRVIKSGRTSGVTRGVVTATRVNGVHVNYGTRSAPRIATFNDTIEIVGEGGTPFSAPGDSGSVIIDRDTGEPVALLFAGDGHTTTACDLGGVCHEFGAFPV